MLLRLIQKLPPQVALEMRIKRGAYPTVLVIIPNAHGAGQVALDLASLIMAIIIIIILFLLLL
jgi:hypothetical protein